MKLLALSLDSSVNQQVWEFLLSGGTFMFFIVVCSLVSAAIVIHRMISLRREEVMPGGLTKMLEHAEPGRVDTRAVSDLSVKSESPLGDIVVAALGNGAQATGRNDVNEASRAAETVAREEVLRLQTGLSVLEDVITIAPLLGLLGTVSGLVGVFAELGSSGGENADPAVLASGIARALNTTIAGLAVAVPTVIARSYFTKKIETMAARMEVLVGRLIHAVSNSAGADGARPIAQADALAVPSQGQADMSAVATAPHTSISPTAVPEVTSADAPHAGAEPTVSAAHQPVPIPRQTDEREGGAAL